MTGTPVHPIALERVLFLRSSVIAVPGHQPGSGEPNVTPTNNIEIQPVPGEPGRYSANMRTQVNPTADPSGPYGIDMECMGLFVVDQALPPDEAHRCVLITAHSVLYGAIREAVAWLTGRQPYGTLALGLSILQIKPPSDLVPEPLK